MSLVKNFNRLVVLTNDTNLGPNFVPPTQAQIIASVIDPNHESMVSSGLYTQTQVDTLRSNAIAYLNTQFGIDFSTGTVEPDGSIVLLPFVMIPYTSARSAIINVSFDSQNVDRGAVLNSWYGFQYGEIVACEAEGTFPGGLHQGDNYEPGDILTYFDYNLIRSKGGVPLPTQDREIITCKSPYTSKTLINSQTLTDTLSKLVCTNSSSVDGFFDENIMFEKLDDGTFETKTRVTMTWPVTH